MYTVRSCRIVGALLVALAVLVSSTDAGAGPLAATKPSQMVTLLNVGQPAGCLSSFAAQITPEGDLASFDIPADRVLVVTQLQVQHTLGGGTPGTVRIHELRDNTGQSLGAGVYAVADSAGNYAATADVGNLIIKPNVVVCVTAPTTTRVYLRGFLASDR